MEFLDFFLPEAELSVDKVAYLHPHSLTLAQNPRSTVCGHFTDHSRGFPKFTAPFLKWFFRVLANPAGVTPLSRIKSCDMI
jgi:hypothetical protein